MPAPKPKPFKTPFEQTNTYGTQSIADTPEAQALLDVPIDVDPGVGRRTDLAEQEAENRWDSAFMSGVPSFIREANRAKELRGIRSQGAYEAQNAQAEKNRMELARRQLLLPQILQTGSSGFGTQIVQPQPGFLHKAGLSLIGGAANTARMMAGGMG